MTAKNNARLDEGTSAESRLGTSSQKLEARRDLAALTLAAHIRRVVDQAPPLTPEQREQLARILGGAPA